MIVECPILIPAYQPPDGLVDLVAALIAAGRQVVVVDDGSGAGWQPLFERVMMAGATLLVHPANQGKGVALRTGLAAVISRDAGCPGVITCDADGQHTVEDVLAVAGRFDVSPQALWLGCRGLGSAAPRRSRWGNRLTRHALRRLFALDLHDTQTGLRGIPGSLIPTLLTSTTSGYAFELEMLVRAQQQGLSLREHPIQTRYAARNATSHYRPIRDSLHIARIILQLARMKPRT